MRRAITSASTGSVVHPVRVAPSMWVNPKQERRVSQEAERWVMWGKTNAICRL